MLKPVGAEVPKLSVKGDSKGPVLDLKLEAQLSSIAPLKLQAATKSFDMTLRGDMAAYSWALETNALIAVDKGDRVEVSFTNASMMAHPMHLHGHHFQVVAIDGKRFAGAVRDTVLVPPMRSLTIAVNANNPGQWAFHCHHLYHMVRGMMGTFGYRA
jgi:FtsP/CotA-like multicopper oxidase with cupredoxin domain